MELGYNNLIFRLSHMNQRLRKTEESDSFITIYVAYVSYGIAVYV